MTFLRFMMSLCSMILFAMSLSPPVPPEPPGLLADTMLSILNCSCSNILPDALVKSITKVAISLTHFSTLIESTSTLSLHSAARCKTLAMTA